MGFVGEHWPYSSLGCRRLEGWALGTSWVRLTQTPELRSPCAPRPRAHPAVSSGTRGHRTGNLDGGRCCLPATPLLWSADTLPQAPLPQRRDFTRQGACAPALPRTAGGSRRCRLGPGTVCLDRLCRLWTAVAPSSERQPVCTCGSTPGARPLTWTSFHQNGSPEGA